MACLLNFLLSEACHQLEVTIMKTNRLLIALLTGAMTIAGCRHFVGVPDLSPPAPPTGLRTATGDNFIEIFWRGFHEPDLSGYRVYVSSSYNGRYQLIGETTSEYFVDNGARNGNIYYYAVSAYDYNGNESDLSKDVAYDIPRPEGYNVTLSDYRVAPATSAYDFSAYAVVLVTDKYADMWFENYNGLLYMNVDTDSDIQDMGPTGSILDIGMAPAGGWSTSHDVLLAAGHTYVVWTWDDHYAKFRVRSLAPNRVVFDWAYQLVESSRLMKKMHGNDRVSAPVPKSR
jgi:hypothetical protein